MLTFLRSEECQWGFLTQGTKLWMQVNGGKIAITYLYVSMYTQEIVLVYPKETWWSH